MEKTKKLLIAGGGYSDIPLILSAKKLGFHVITTGNRPNELGHNYSDEYHHGDFSNLAEMLSLAEKLKIDAICSCSNDFSAISAAYVAEKLGLPGHDSYENALTLHHKDRYRKFARTNNLLTPYAESFNDIEAAINAISQAHFKFPLIIKPIDLTGGKGVSKVNKEDECKGAIEKAFTISRAKRIVIEEFIEGSQHSISTFIRDGKVVFYFSDNEYSYRNPYLVSTSSTPSLAGLEAEQKVIPVCEKIASLLNLKDGIFHLQYLLRDKEPVIIEITRRCPGDFYANPVNYATGIDYATWIVRASTGLGIAGLSQVNPEGFFGRHCIMSATGGKVSDIIFDKSIEPNIIEKFMWWKPGDIVTDVLTSKFGLVFLKYESIAEMIEKTALLPELIKVKTI
jgi:biotin carboxylase